MFFLEKEQCKGSIRLDEKIVTWVIIAKHYVIGYNADLLDDVDEWSRGWFGWFQGQLGIDHDNNKNNTNNNLVLLEQQHSSSSPPPPPSDRSSIVVSSAVTHSSTMAPTTFFLWKKEFQPRHQSLGIQAAKPAWDRKWRLEYQALQELMVRNGCSCVYCSDYQSKYEKTPRISASSAANATAAKKSSTSPPSRTIMILPGLVCWWNWIKWPFAIIAKPAWW
jgi:hypothetical protein